MKAPSTVSWVFLWGSCLERARQRTAPVMVPYLLSHQKPFLARGALALACSNRLPLAQQQAVLSCIVLVRRDCAHAGHAGQSFNGQRLQDARGGSAIRWPK